VAAVAGKPPTTKASTGGKDIFLANCGSCHTLADAGTSGTVGPNLDQLKPGELRVQRQVINGGGAMPAFKGTLTPAQITAVAKYVASSAGG
jgi:mono/diheme cytochrome c family protein